MGSVLNRSAPPLAAAVSSLMLSPADEQDQRITGVPADIVTSPAVTGHVTIAVTISYRRLTIATL
jgi:hypothetical protein